MGEGRIAVTVTIHITDLADDLHLSDLLGETGTPVQQLPPTIHNCKPEQIIPTTCAAYSNTCMATCMYWSPVHHHSDQPPVHHHSDQPPVHHHSDQPSIQLLTHVEFLDAAQGDLPAGS